MIMERGGGRGGAAAPRAPGVGVLPWPRSSLAEPDKPTAGRRFWFTASRSWEALCAQGMYQVTLSDEGSA
jgi:hypothetical protein